MSRYKDKHESSKHIIYPDANNLYEWPITQQLHLSVQHEMKLKHLILRWCRSPNFDGSQIPVTTRAFEM